MNIYIYIYSFCANKNDAVFLQITLMHYTTHYALYVIYTLYIRKKIYV